MPDTPEFSQYQSRSQAHTEDALIKTDPSVTDANHVQTIQRALEALRQYFTENDFRATLPLGRKRAIEGQINNILGQFDEIMRLKREGNLPGSIESIATNISSYLDDVELRFTTPFKVFILEGREDTSSIVSSVKSSAEEINRSKAEVEKTLKDAKLLTGRGADIAIANFFQRLANGMTVDDNDKMLKEARPNLAKLWRIYLFSGLAIAIVFALGAGEIVNVFEEFDGATAWIRLNAFIVILISGVGLILHSWLNRTRPSGYERAAILWVIGGVLSTIGTGMYAAVLLAQLGDSPGWNELVPTLVSLLAPAYLIRLCVRNYRANKHLAVQNTHRAAVAQVVAGFADRLTRTEESLLSESLRLQGSIYQRTTALIFDPGETGFLSRSEGAGSSDNFIDESLARLNR